MTIAAIKGQCPYCMRTDDLPEMVKKGETGMEQCFLQYFHEDLPTLNAEQLGKVYRYMRRIRAGIER